MILLIFLALTFFLQLLGAVWYSISESCKPKKDCFKFRLITSGIYLADSFLASSIALTQNKFGIFNILIIIGTLLYFLGDILFYVLKNKEKEAELIFHTIGNVVFFGGLTYKVKALFDQKILSLPFILCVIVIFSLGFIFVKIRENKRDILTSVYLSSAFYLILGGIHLGIFSQITGEGILQSISFSSILGSLLLWGGCLMNSNIFFKKLSKEKALLYKNSLTLFGIMILICTSAL